MKQADQMCMKLMRMPSEQLMEIAGKSIADRIYQKLLKKDNISTILIGCGTGNNGGDGFVIARWLHQYKFNCKVILFGNVEALTKECKINYERCNTLNIPIILSNDEQAVKDAIKESSIFVDAIFGVSFHGVLNNDIKSILSLVKSEIKAIYAVDIVSGIDSNSGITDEDSLFAETTYCIGAYKYGHLLKEGKIRSGELQLIDIGIPPMVFDKIRLNIKFMEDCDVSYPVRSHLSHKGSYGRIAIIAGSEAYVGAALLSCKACLKSGAGLIYLFHRSSLSHDYKGKIPEIICRSISEDQSQLPNETELLSELKRMDCIMIGPGITTDLYAQKLVKLCLELSKEQAVIFDADAINIISQDERLKKQLKNSNSLITPHLLEFSRIKQKGIQEIETDIIAEIFKFYREYKIPLLLKSNITFNGYEDRITIINKGNDGLSTGGSGDVLAGIIASFVGQYICHEKTKEGSQIETRALLSKAAENASYLMGKTAEYLNRIMETPAITPTEIILNLFKK